MAPLHYAAELDPFLSLGCAPTPSTLAQSKERKASNFAIWQPRTKDIVYMSSSMRRIFPLPENHLDYRVVYDPVAYRVSLRIQNATELIVNDPFSSEAYQVMALCVLCLPKPELRPDGQTEKTCLVLGKQVFAMQIM